MNTLPQLRLALVDAAARRREASPAEAPEVAPAVRSRPRVMRRTLVLVAFAAVALVSSAAAVVVLTVTPSKPLTGTLPPSPSAGVRALPPERYEIAIFPELRAGAAGWSLYLFEKGAPLPRSHGAPQGLEGVGGGSAPAAGAHFIAGISATNGNPARALSANIVDGSVARVRFPDGRLIAPIASAGLPFGWRAVVTLVPVRTRRITLPGRGATGRRSVELPIPLDSPLVPIGRNGATLPINVRRPLVGVRARALDPRRPPAGACEIRLRRRLAGLWAGPQRVVTLPAPRRLDLDGRAFLDCAQARYRIGAAQMVAAVLVDDENPRRPAAALPAITRRSGDLVIGAVPNITARREGPRWLVVQGGTARSRATLIAALRSTGPS